MTDIEELMLDELAFECELENAAESILFDMKIDQLYNSL